ncbi:MAG: hypothetical protein MUP55_01700 [Candidatus Aenigmarchaeota archaeon]|nr:hypothetical protein [Candidatus Aenigmarchaeota archaeon]
MKLLSFGKKKQGPVMPSPTERVMTLSSQGLSEPEIIQTLRGEGYKPVQVDTAMREALRGVAAGTGPGMQPARQLPQRYAPSQQEYAPVQREYAPRARTPQSARPYAELSSAYEEFPEEEAEEEPLAGYPPRVQKTRQPPSPGPLPEPPLDFEEFKKSNKDLGFPEIPGTELPQERMPRTRMPPEQPEEEFEEEEEQRPIPRFMPRERARGEGRQEKRRMIEELTEGVVEEKWQDFRRRIDDMSSMFQQLNQRISILEQKLSQTQGEKKSDLMEIEGKIDTYKQSIDQIQSRMESVERAMKDSLTPMMQTLRSLSETIKALKERKG